MIFGLTTALCWGASDLLAAFETRRIGSRATAAIAQMAGLVAALLLVVVTTPVWRIPTGDELILLGSGACAGVAYFALYRGLELGPIALVSPIASAFASVTVLLAVVVAGERPSALALAGAVLTLVGVVLSSTDLRRMEAEAKRHLRGIPFALAAMVGFGVAAFIGGDMAQRYGWLPPVVLSRAGSLILILAVLAFTAGSARTDHPVGLGRREIAIASVIGVTDIAGVAFYARGSELGLISITAAVAATFTLIPVAGGVVLFGERPAPNQYIGVGLVVVGLVLLGVGG